MAANVNIKFMKLQQTWTLLPRRNWNVTQLLSTTENMPTNTAYVRANNTATIVCPACGARKNINTLQLKGKRHTVKVRCRCNVVFDIQIDFRHSYRKPISLPGTYTILRDGQGGGVIHIRNISTGGIGFTVSGIHQLKKGQVLGIEFQLNDKNQTTIRKKTVIVSVNKNQIGCRFSASEETGKALGFFLQS